MRILIKQAGGGVGIMHANPEQEESALTAYAEKWVDTEFAYVSRREVDESEIPSDRTFRDAWLDSGNEIIHDMPKCREIWRNRLRELRAAKLIALDIAYIRADEIGDNAEKQRIITQKQALRDVTDDPRIEAAQTPDALKAVMPDELK